MRGMQVRQADAGRFPLRLVACQSSASARDAPGCRSFAPVVAAARRQLPVGDDASLAELEGWRVFTDYASYNEALFDDIVCWEFAPFGYEDFQARMRTRRCGAVTFSELDLSPLHAIRRTHDIDRQTDNCIGIALFEEGGQQMRHANKRVEANSGDVMIWSATAPIDIAQPRASRAILLLFPKSMVDKHVGNIDELCGDKIDGSTPQGRILASHLQALRDTLEQVDVAARAELMKVTLNLFAACVNAGREPMSRTGYQQALMRRIQSHIRQSMHDPAFSLASVAQAFGFSTRNLSRHFADHGTTFYNWVLGERVAQAAKALESPAFQFTSLTEIASRFGFYDASHFSRSFKKVMGQAPLQFRRERGRLQ